MSEEQTPIETVKLTIHMPLTELKKLTSALSVKRVAGKFSMEDRIDTLSLAFVSAIEQGKEEILLKERK